MIGRNILPMKELHSQLFKVSNRACHDTGNILYLHCPMWQLLAQVDTEHFKSG